ncbi:histone H1.3-like [Dicentrarchus labrax]|uniref:histone H1.3-like n=1 Tax=Dicentrarchus labrax TaxID=13489 RepID=UPI0021F600CA|nr:histone H1.3-like [Dicentrarchus labrax]
MRGKATPKKTSPRGAQGNANINIKAREKTHLKVLKQIGRTTKTPTGKGLGKAGAKRLGRLLKRAIQVQEEVTAKGKVSSLPKTPVRLFKHQIQSGAENAPKTNTARPASPQVSQLILSVVSQCKHRGGMSMAELKQTLAAEGYNVTKNSRQVNVVTKRLVNNETLVRTTRSISFRLNNKTDTKQVKPKGDVKQGKTAIKSSKEAEKSQRQARKTPKPKSKTPKPAARSHKPTGKTRKAVTRSQKPTGKTRKAVTRSQKPTGKTRKAVTRSQKPTGKTRKAVTRSQKPTGKTRKAVTRSQKPTGKTRKAAAKSHKPMRKTAKPRRKSPKPAGKKRRSATNQTVRLRKGPRKAQTARRRRPKQNQQPYKTSRKRQPPKRRLPTTRPRMRTRRRPVTRRAAYYY